MKKLFLWGTTCLLLLLICSTVQAATLSIIDTPTLLGSELNKASPAIEQYAYQAYDTTNNLAFGAGTPIVSSTLPGYSTIHNPTFLNDGFYGNGSSWIGTTANSWIKIDLGTTYDINELLFGRDRLGYFDERDPGRFLISLAAMDAVFADGDTTDDDSEYQTVFNGGGAATPFSGSINFNDTIKAEFDTTAARFVMIKFEYKGAAIDEIEIHGTLSTVPEPATMFLFGLGLLGLAGASRRKK